MATGQVHTVSGILFPVLLATSTLSSAGRLLYDIKFCEGELASLSSTEHN